MPRTRKLLVIALLLLPLAGASVAIVSTPRFQKWYNPPVPPSFTVVDVIEIKAALNAGTIFEKIPAFTVAPKYHAWIVKCLQPAEYRREFQQMHDYCVGEVWITFKDGHQLHLTFYDWGKNPLAYSENGEDFFFRCSNNQSWPNGYCDGLYLGAAIQSAFEKLEPLEK